MTRTPVADVQEPLFAPAEPEREFDVQQLLEPLKRHRRLITVIAIVVVAASLVIYATTPKSYRAATVLQVERRMAGPVRVEDIIGVESYWDAQSFYPTQFALIRSRGMAERVVQRLRLAEDPVFNPVRAELPSAAHVGGGAVSLDARELARLAGRIQQGLTVQPVKDTRLVEISYVSPSPELSARIANGVAEAYIDWGIEMRGISVEKASSFLNSQIESIKREIADKEAELQAYSRSATDIVALDPASNVALQRLEALNKDYIAAVSERINKEARYQQLVNSPRDAVPESVAGGLVASLRSEVLRLERDYASKLATYKPDWPAMQSLKEQIEKARQNLAAAYDETLRGARTEYETALRREQSLAEELTRQKGQALELNSAAVAYNNLKVEVQTRRTLLDELLRKQSQTEVASRMQGSRESNVVVVDRALAPARPFRPSLPQHLGIGVTLGLLAGLGLAYGLHFLDRTCKSRDDVERVLGLPVLGVIPDISAAGRGYGYYGYGYGYYGYGYGSGQRRRDKKQQQAVEQVDIELVCLIHPRMQVSEAFRGLRTSLLLSSAQSLEVVLVTSTTVGEGKTATSGNLAVVLAQLGKHVLLVDGDLRRPRQHEIFKISNRAGLVNFITGQAEPAEVFLRSAVPNLYLTPSGPVPPNPSELLASARAHEFFALARQRFDFVVIDSPPVLPVTDATVLSRVADGVVVCVGAGIVNRGDAKECLARLSLVEARVLGAVFNRERAAEGRYGKAYHRGYKAYIEDAASQTGAAAAKAG